MKVFLLILVSSIVALSVDIYIYRRIIKRHNFGGIWKVGYIIYALVVDTMVVTSLIAYNTVIDWESTASMRAILWVIGLFFLNAVPKSVYAVVSLLDYPVQKRTGRVSHIFGYTGTALALLCFLWLGYGMTFGRSVIRVEKVELTFDNLPASFDGLRVVFFTDPHMGNLVNRDRMLARLSETVNSLGPDIIVNGGDLVNIHERELDQAAMDILGTMKARYGIFSVLGNHDLGIYIRDTVKNPPSASVAALTQKQERLGWQVLRNRTVPLTSGSDTIYVTGLDYPMDFSLNSHSSLMEGAEIGVAYAGVPRDAFNLAISHAPQLWSEMLEAGVGDLTLAGHVHSMQIKFRLGKWSWSPARFFYKRWSGLYREGGQYLYINDGIGYVMFPMRLGTKPEVTLFVLRSRSKTN